MSSREPAIVFDDGSIESKVLQHELKTSYDITVVPVDKYEDLPKWLDEAIKKTEGLFKGIIKIFLHFPFEDYVTKDIRTQMMEIEHNNTNIRIIPWYEQAPRDRIKNRAANYGIVAEPVKPNRVQEQLKDIKETIIDPDDEMTINRTGISGKFNKPLGKNNIDPDDEMKADVANIASDILKDTKKSRKKKWNI